jgi:hypothetical protein
MSEPMQPTPRKEGGLEQPPQTSPAPSDRREGGSVEREDALHDRDRAGGMIGEGDSED